MRLVIAKASQGRIIAIEHAGIDEDWPPSPREIVDRWRAQGVVKDDRQVEVWEEARGYYFTPLKGIPSE